MADPFDKNDLFEKKPDLFSWMRDRLYDSVFHVGDTALQFTGDIIRGPDHARSDAYADRQLGRAERKLHPSKPAQPVPTKPEKSLNFEERRIFVEMLRRKESESIIEHWKRQKELLSHPRKRQLVQIEQKLNSEASKKQAVEVEMKSAASKYQKERSPKKVKYRTRGRSR